MKFRLDHQHNNRAWLAWNVAALMRAKRMPRLQTLMIKRRDRRKQSWQEQRDIVKILNAAFDGTVEKHTKH